MAQKTILIVDDEELTLMLTEGILSKQYNTIRALSGEEAITLLKNDDGVLPLDGATMKKILVVGKLDQLVLSADEITERTALCCAVLVKDRYFQ